MLKNSEFIWKCRFRCVSVVRSGCSEISLVQVESLFGKLGGQTSILSIKRRSIVTNSCSKTPDSFQTDFSVYFESAQVDNFRQLSTTFPIRDTEDLKPGRCIAFWNVFWIQTNQNECKRAQNMIREALFNDQKSDLELGRCTFSTRWFQKCSTEWNSTFMLVWMDSCILLVPNDLSEVSSKFFNFWEGQDSPQSVKNYDIWSKHWTPYT